MNPHLKYQSTSSLSWTRIDMLLVVYDKVSQSLQEGLRALAGNRPEELQLSRMGVQRSVLTIVDGLNLEVGDTPAQILRLCLYVLEQTRTDSPEAWRSSLQVMQTVQQGFEAIQQTAREAEYRGELPALDTAAR